MILPLSPFGFREISDRVYEEEASTSEDEAEDYQAGGYGQMAAFGGYGQDGVDESAMARCRAAEKPTPSVNKISGAGRGKGKGKPPKAESPPPEPLSPVQQPYSSFNQEQYFASMAQQHYLPQQDYMSMQPQLYHNGMMVMGMYGMQPAYGGYGQMGQQPAPAYSMLPTLPDSRATSSVVSGQRYVSPSHMAGPPPAPSSNERFKSPMRGRGSGSGSYSVPITTPPPVAAPSPLISGSPGPGYASQAPKLSTGLGSGLRPKPGSSSAMSAYAYEAMLAQQAAAAAQQQQQQLAQQYAQVFDAPSSAAEAREGLPYSRKPRVVDYQPYELKVGVLSWEFE